MTHTPVFTSPLFWNALDLSGSVNESRGMRKHELKAGAASLVTFSKTHSYGEYIFDWAWAQAYERQGLAYYPKLTSMVPFTPATSPHFLGPSSHWPELLAQHDALLQGHSSAHFLFTTPDEQRFLGEQGYLLRDSFQYHFFNEGDRDIDEFLGRLKAKKAKHIRQERIFPQLRIERLTGAALNSQLADEMYGFYLSTLEHKQAIAYLTQDFFRRVFTDLSENVLYVRATQEDAAVAGALYFYDDERLYGRYWGCHQDVTNLHFELCYYQGIEFCLAKKLKVFEAGAQGEHKISRGFRPVLISSAHRIRHPGFSKAISDYVLAESKQVRATMSELARLLPFRSS